MCVTMKKEVIDISGDAQQQPIKVVVRSPDGIKKWFLMEYTQEFRNLFNAYCDMQCVSMTQMKYTLNGQEINEFSTPQSLNFMQSFVVDARLRSREETYDHIMKKKLP